MFYPIHSHIQGARLRLTAITAAELELYQMLYADPVTMQYIGPCYHKDQSAIFFQNCLEKTEQSDSGWHFYSIQLLDQAEAIGLVSLIAKPFADAPYELGIVLKAASRGADYAVEALTALFLHCFTEANIPALLACGDARNPGMMKLIRHFGFVSAPEAYKKRAALSSFLLHATTDNISYLRQLSQQFQKRQQVIANIEA